MLCVDLVLDADDGAGGLQTDVAGVGVAGVGEAADQVGLVEAAAAGLGDHVDGVFLEEDGGTGGVEGLELLVGGGVVVEEWGKGGDEFGEGGVEGEEVLVAD